MRWALEAKTWHRSRIRKRSKQKFLKKISNQWRRWKSKFVFSELIDLVMKLAIATYFSLKVIKIGREWCESESRGAEIESNRSDV